MNKEKGGQLAMKNLWNVPFPVQVWCLVDITRGSLSVYSEEQNKIRFWNRRWISPRGKKVHTCIWQQSKFLHFDPTSQGHAIFKDLWWVMKFLTAAGNTNYRISRIFRVGLIFAEFVTSLKSPKIDTAKKPLLYVFFESPWNSKNWDSVKI